MIMLWFIAALSFLFLELGNPGLFFFLSLFFGCIAAGIVAVIDQSIIIQSITALGVSFIALLILYYWLRNCLIRNHPPRTNVYALQGKKAIVIKIIKPNMIGQINIEGQLWSAKGLGNQSYMPGDIVEVMSIQGCHAFVKIVN